ncbi:unnamed protein product [Rotaria sp. Silwood1]|nr:unnamed protein product [Rotaria sp. Silwood1]CAF1547859.1 unnamed protein product [Rotaria sp. Silwood1]CAF3634547.1 unnamed protein product [Rotaria sp. Silwood1]CAF3714032.1 unnamed protein product [Rotaria sp. Silwood1]CAF4538440.1 unnamed protein product [Rotaria sp. Silwood1]
MQTKTLLALFFTIVVLLIGANDGAPAAPKPVAAKEDSNKPVIKPTLPGGRSAWQTNIDAHSKKLFNDHKSIISKKLQSVHKVPAKFQLKPSKVATQSAGGILYHYLVKVPKNKYAYVTIHAPPASKSNQLPKEENVNVKPGLYGLKDKNI